MTTICGKMKIPAIFGNSMVLRQNIPIKVWGKANSMVTITLAGNEATAMPENGIFRAVLPPLVAGGPYEMIITDGENEITFTDVMIGEVWICSGQSNMELNLSGSENGYEDAKNAKDDYLRLFNVAHVATYEPADDAIGSWSRTTEEDALTFSAVGYYFGRKLRETLNVAVGLINSSWGGTIVEAWTGKEAIEANPLLKEIADDYEEYIATISDPKKAYETIMNDWKQSTAYQTNSIDVANVGYAQGFASLNHDDRELPKIETPGNWLDRGIDHHGVIWFRKCITLPESFLGRDLVLHFPPIDKSDVAYFNNVHIGSMRWEDNSSSWATPRKYLVPKELTQEPEALIAVRIFSNIFCAGFVGEAEHMYLTVANSTDDEKIDLSGTWSYIVEQDFGLNTSFPAPPKSPPGPNNPNLPYAIVRAMIDPIAPFAVSGAIWYQGESNADNKDDALSYRVKLPAMIADWRNKFEVGDFPFYIVEIANFDRGYVGDEFYSWPILRESQYLTTQSVKNCDMTTIIDIGDSIDIHPTNKHDVGERLARLALHHDYGKKDIALKGPVFKSMEIVGDKAVLEFDFVYNGFVVKGDELLAFKIAGENREFVDAKAEIEGNKIIVSANSVTEPIAVRYAFVDDPICNIFNSENLPMMPFRTDKFEI